MPGKGKLLGKGNVVLIILTALAILWTAHAYHYYWLLGYYLQNFDYFNDLKVMVLTFILETWYLTSLILLTYVLVKIVDILKGR